MKNLILTLFTLLSVTAFTQENPALLNEQNPKEYIMTEEDFQELLRFKKSDLNIDSLKEEIFKIFNEYRRYKNLPEFEYSDVLEKSANIQAKYMGENRIVTHSHKDNELKTTKDRIEYVDINEVMISEKYGEICSQNNYINVIARKRTLPQSVLDGFYNSGPHRHIIEKEMYTDMGIGIYKEKNSQTFYVCIDFCVSKK
jgi:uncharacterized protein YkwD